MARLVGSGRALQLVLAAKALKPEEAAEHRLIEELSDDAVASATEIATEISELPPTAVAMAKRIVYQGDGLPLSVALDLELESAYRAKQSPDAARALEEYLAVPLEKRRDWLDR